MQVKNNSTKYLVNFGAWSQQILNLTVPIEKHNISQYFNQRKRDREGKKERERKKEWERERERERKKDIKRERERKIGRYRKKERDR